jgi:hypothetical protein
MGISWHDMLDGDLNRSLDTSRTLIVDWNSSKDCSVQAKAWIHYSLRLSPSKPMARFKSWYCMCSEEKSDIQHGNMTQPRTPLQLLPAGLQISLYHEKAGWRATCKKKSQLDAVLQNLEFSSSVRQHILRILSNAAGALHGQAVCAARVNSHYTCTSLFPLSCISQCA